MKDTFSFLLKNDVRSLVGFLCAFCHFCHQPSDKKWMPVRKAHLDFLTKRMADHKLVIPEMIRQPISHFLRVRLKFFWHRQSTRRSRIGQWWVQHVERYPQILVFQLQTFRQRFDRAFRRRIRRNASKSCNTNARTHEKHTTAMRLPHIWKYRFRQPQRAKIIHIHHILVS